MKNLQKGSGVLIIITAVVLLTVGVGTYFYISNNVNSKNTEKSNIDSVATTTVVHGISTTTSATTSIAPTTTPPETKSIPAPKPSNVTQEKKQPTYAPEKIVPQVPEPVIPPIQKENFSFLVFDFAPDVSSEDQAIIRKGITDMATYQTKWFGRTVTNTTSIKATADANDTTCCNVGGSGSNSWITFHTKHTEWVMAQLAAMLFTDMRRQLALHELVHTYQTQYGCGMQEQPVALRWMNEGMAEWLAFRAMIDMGVVTESRVLEYNKFMYKNAKAESLVNYELYHKGIDYSVFYLAVDQIMKKSPITSLDGFCVNLGKGQDKTEAFQSAFGFSLSKFYEDFEAYRLTL